MAWIVGAVTPAELQHLRELGWKDEKPPKKYRPKDYKKVGKDGSVVRAFFVDNDLYKIMTGTDWDTERSTRKLVRASLYRSRCRVARTRERIDRA